MKTILNGPFTLALSSGFFGFYAHVGFVKAIDEMGYKPKAYTGASAGAIIAAALASGMSIKQIEALTLGVSRELFWDPSLGLGFLRGRKLQEFLAKEIGTDFTQLEKPLRISTFDIAKRSTQVFSTGPLARVVRASCSVPLMFHPAVIDRRLYWDGGVLDKMAIAGLPHEEKILSHYLESRRRDLHSMYELKRDQKTLRARAKNVIQVSLKGLPNAGPFALDRGASIIEAAYRATRLQLQTMARE